jgi:cyclic pyranopterin phosphate synthase
VKKIRLTGGEPLLRKGLPGLVEMLAPLGADLTLTTNGSTLVKHAAALKEAGLDPHHREPRFARRSDLPRHERRGFPGRERCSTASAPRERRIHPVKINMVVKRGVNDHQIVEAARTGAIPATSCAS